MATALAWPVSDRPLYTLAVFPPSSPSTPKHASAGSGTSGSFFVATGGADHQIHWLQIPQHSGDRGLLDTSLSTKNSSAKNARRSPAVAGESYSGRFHHSDWVTCTSALSNPSNSFPALVSGGMDGRLILWPAPSSSVSSFHTKARARPAAVRRCPSPAILSPPHAASIADIHPLLDPLDPAGIAADTALPCMFAAASYDGTASFWRLDDGSEGAARCRTTLVGPTTSSPSGAQPPSLSDPVLGSLPVSAVAAQLVVYSHTRSGAVWLHTIDSARAGITSTATRAAGSPPSSAPTASMRCHRGRLAALLPLPDGRLFATAGARDGGNIHVYDPRLAPDCGRRVARWCFPSAPAAAAITAGVAVMEPAWPASVAIAPPSRTRLAAVDAAGRAVVLELDGGALRPVLPTVDITVPDAYRRVAARPLQLARYVVRSGGSASSGDTTDFTSAFAAGADPATEPYAAVWLPPPPDAATGTRPMFAVAWGDGSLTLLRDPGGSGGSGVGRDARYVDIPGVRNALRKLALADYGRVLVGAGDDGVVVAWDVQDLAAAF